MLLKIDEKKLGKIKVKKIPKGKDKQTILRKRIKNALNRPGLPGDSNA